jgi:hypothetical protein
VAAASKGRRIGDVGMILLYELVPFIVGSLAVLVAVALDLRRK